MPQPETNIHTSTSVRVGYILLGVFSTLLGIIGAFLPVMPTTCFLLVALWAFSKSSPKLHGWLWKHKHLGAPLRRWEQHRCIPIAAKIAAVASMLGSLLFVILFSGIGTTGLTAITVFIAVSAFIVLRIPSYPPGRPADCANPQAAIELAKLRDGDPKSVPTECKETPQ